jgi:hypothetical protein
MGALAGAKKLDFLHQEVLPIESLSDLSIHVPLFYFVFFVFFVVSFKSFSVFSVLSVVKSFVCGRLRLIKRPFRQGCGVTLRSPGS